MASFIHVHPVPGSFTSLRLESSRGRLDREKKKKEKWTTHSSKMNYEKTIPSTTKKLIHLMWRKSRQIKRNQGDYFLL